MVRLRLPQLFQQTVHPCSGSFTSISQRDISIATEINAILIEYLCVVKLRKECNLLEMSIG